MSQQVRRIVTGGNVDGVGTFTTIEDVVPVSMGSVAWFGIWGWDDHPELPYTGADTYKPRSVFPKPEKHGGLRVNAVTFPAGFGVDGTKNTPSQEYLELLAAEPPGGEHDSSGGMHSTDTIDFCLVLSGQVDLVQEDRTEVTLKAGDVCIQNGEMHAWKNTSEEDCLIVFVMVGANRDGVGSDRGGKA
jgi:hypothetical protein